MYVPFDLYNSNNDVQQLTAECIDLIMQSTKIQQNLLHPEDWTVRVKLIGSMESHIADQYCTIPI